MPAATEDFPEPLLPLITTRRVEGEPTGASMSNPCPSPTPSQQLGSDGTRPVWSPDLRARSSAAPSGTRHDHAAADPGTIPLTTAVLEARCRGSTKWQTGPVKIGLANTDDVAGLARLLWQDTLDEEPAQQSVDPFAEDVARWWTDHRHSHAAFVARHLRAGIIGMAWVALLPRVPRPGATSRHSADIQSLFVVPEHRGQGIGSALVEAASEHAMRLGATRVTVHSGRRAVPVYERLGFEASRQLMHRPTR